jgi:hypothetical protein
MKDNLQGIDYEQVKNYLQGLNLFIYFLRGGGVPLQWSVNSGQ